MTRRELGQKLERLLRLLIPVLTEQEYDDVAGFWGQSEWDLAVDLAARLVIERARPITQEIYDLFAALLPEARDAGRHDLAAMRALVTSSS